jgi:serine/threonine protein kinase
MASQHERHWHEQAPISVPVTLGRYRVHRLLGTGGMGAVYEAEATSGGARVALKTLTRLSPAGLLGFKQEFRRAAQLSHPHLVSLYELSQDGGVWFFSMELIRGPHLLSYVWGSETYPGTEPAIAGTLHVLPQLLESIAFLHEHGILHLDIKPSNILTTAEGATKLLDFGLSELDPEHDAGDSKPCFAGTPGYMAPEQIAGVRSRACDCYALGATLFEVMSGRLPFDEGCTSALISKRTRPAPPIVEFARGTPPALATIIDGLLQRDPALRFGIDEVRRTLGPLLSPAKPSRTSRPTSHLIGRKGELERLSELTTRLTAGSVVCQLVGDSGVGKSSLLRAAMSSWRALGAVVLSSRCHQWEAIPFKAADALIDQLYEYALTYSEELTFADDLGLATRMFPVLDGLPLKPIAVRPTDPHAERTRAAEALGDLLAQVARRTSVILCIDDAHWGDAESADVVAQMVNAVPNGLALILSQRSTSSLPNPFGKLLLSSLQHATQIEIALAPLDAHDSFSLARAVSVAGTWSDEQLRSISDDAAGVPIFIEQVVRLGKSVAGRAPTMNEVIDNYCQTLEPEQQALLDMVVIAEHPTPLRHLCNAAGLVGQVHRVVAGLQAAGLLRCEGLDEGALLEPYHDRVRQGVLARIAPVRQKALHFSLAERLELAGETPGRIVDHWFQAGELTRAAESASRAAHLACEALAFEQACSLYARALKWKPTLPATHPDLLERFAWALYRAGHCGRAGDVFCDAAKAATGEHLLELQGRAAEALLVAGQVDRGKGLIDQLLSALGVRRVMAPPWRLLQLLLLIARVRWQSRSLGSARGHDASALRKADITWHSGKALTDLLPIDGIVLLLRSLLFSIRSGDGAAIARGLCIAASGFAPFLEGVADPLLRVAEQIATEHNDPYLLGMLGVTRSTSGHMRGDWSSVLKEVDRAQAHLAASTFPTNWETSLLEANRTVAQEQLGDFNVVAGSVTRLAAAARRRGDLVTYVSNVSAYGFTRAVANDLAGLTEAIEEMQAVMRSWTAGYGIWHCTLWRLRVLQAVRRNDLPRARDLLKREWPLITDSLLLRTRALRCLILETKAAVVLGSWSEGRFTIGRGISGLLLARAIGSTARTDAPPSGLVWRAAIAHRRENLTLSLAYLKQASDMYKAGNMRERQCLVDWQRAVLAGETALAEQCEESARALGVEDIAGWARYRTPGFAGPRVSLPTKQAGVAP